MSIERVLITGGAGKLGSYVVDAAPEGMSITVLDTAPPKRPGPRHIQASVSDLADVSAAMAGHDAVVHLGAVPNQYEADAETTMAVNVQGTWNVFHAAELAGVRRVILGSSDSVVGVTQVPEEMQAPLYLPIDEAHPLRAVDPYGLSKVLGEKIGRSFAWRGRLEVVALRPAYILFPYLLDETIARGRNPASYEWPAAGAPRPAGGGPWCHYVDPEDVARAVWLAIGLPQVDFDAFFICGPTTYSPQPTLEAVESYFGNLPEVRKAEVYLDIPDAPLFDLSHAREVLGFKGSGDGRRLIDAALGRG